jgi:MoaA/NifB/PqqE/SkfB family radical SAM enzyme
MITIPLDTLSQKYTIDGPFSVAEFYTKPSSELYRTIHSLRQDAFAANHRIVFTCFDDLGLSKIQDFLIKLQKCLTFVDISNCFVLVASNQPWISEFLLKVKHDWAGSTEKHTIEHELYDVPATKIDTTNFTAILNPPDTVCAQPWMSLDIGHGGNFKPCCYFAGNIPQDNGRHYHITTHTLEQVYNSTYMKDLRQQFIQGDRPQGCKRCWSEEQDGSVSKRMLLKHRFIPDSFDANWEQNDIKNLKFVSVKTGNICNLKCRICGPGSSSKIAEEQLGQIPLPERKTHVIYENLMSGQWIKNHAIWNKLTDLDIEYLDITGGEPMLQPQQFQLLQNIIDQGRAHQVQLHYNTNGTMFPDNHADKWKQFKMVEIALSIDNTQDRFEFERSGAEWSELETNLSKFMALRSHNIKIALHLAINIQNVLYLPEICDWIIQQSFDSVHFSHVYDPDILYIGNVTPAAQKLIIDRLSDYECADSKLQKFIQTSIDVIASAEHNDGGEFCKYMKHLDRIRNQDFSATHKDIALAMGY